MVYWICGIIIGMVMGLTGAGGALVAIPLFMQFLGMPLKIASVYSLLAVVIASFSNFIAQRANTNYKIATIIVVSSAFGSFFTAPFKKGLPEYVMALLLVTVSLFAIYGVWFGKKKTQNNNQNIENALIKKQMGWGISIPVGLFLGMLTTFTGLGGGVLMVPVFLKIYSFNQMEAVATSLLAVALSSLASLIIQIINGFEIVFDLNTVYLLIGILGAAIGLKQLAHKFTTETVILISKIVFSAVVVLAIVKII